MIPALFEVKRVIKQIFYKIQFYKSRFDSKFIKNMFSSYTIKKLYVYRYEHVCIS